MSMFSKLYNQITPSPLQQTKLKGLLAMGVLGAATGGFGYALGGLQALYWTLGVNAAINATTIWFSKEITFFLRGVKPVKAGETVEGYDLHSMVRELIQNPHINIKTMPEIGIVDSNILNAFATGRSKDHAGIAINTGLLKQARVTARGSQFSAEQLVQAVLLHELGHIVNQDIKFITSVTLLSLALKTLSNEIYDSHFKRGKYKEAHPHRVKERASNNRHEQTHQDQGKPKPSFFSPLIFLAGWTIPLATHFLKFFVSRTRETAADEKAFECGQGKAMQEALAMLKHGVFKEEGSYTSKELKDLMKDKDFSLCCHSPLNELDSSSQKDNSQQGWISWSFNKFKDLTSSHPPVDSRIQHLKELEEHANKRSI